MAKMGFIATLIGMIVAVMILITTLGTTASLVDDGAESVTQDARCIAAGCFWNSSKTGATWVGECTANNASSLDNVTCATASANQAYTGESLFNTGGIVILLFIAVGMILAVSIIMGWKAKK